uniref:Uncharacterized protein n=1 Tax=Pseudomonas phage HRDY3 TaxID=3236930 RepID=A0AB39CDG4_9VIRU
MNRDQLMCPYCNQKLLNYTVPAFISACCSKLVAASEQQTVDVRVFIPAPDYAKTLPIQGDISPIKGVTIRDANRGRESRWTMIYWDSEWYVRLIGGFDLEKAGLSHGLSFGQKFSTPKEAAEHADRIDRVMDLIVARVVEETAEFVGKEIVEQLS